MGRAGRGSSSDLLTFQKVTDVSGGWRISFGLYGIDSSTQGIHCHLVLLSSLYSSGSLDESCTGFVESDKCHSKKTALKLSNFAFVTSEGMIMKIEKR